MGISRYFPNRLINLHDSSINICIYVSKVMVILGASWACSIFNLWKINMKGNYWVSSISNVYLQYVPVFDIFCSTF